jgi:hypothetical protein
MSKLGAKINPLYMVIRFLAVVVMLALVACAATRSKATLSSAEATRLADSKAQSTGHDLHRYHRDTARYDAADDSWWVTYWREHDKDDQFNIQVEDKTKKAWLVLN